MKPVKDFSGAWNPEKRAIYFKWDVSGLGSDRYIYILGLKENDGAYYVDRTRYKLFNVADMTNTTLSATWMPVPSLQAGVHKMLFCAYSTPKAENLPDDAILAACRNEEASIIGVMMGRANIVYVAETSLEENAKVVKIHLKSDSNIAEGVLGYRYRMDNCEVAFPFPGAVGCGKTVFPPILIPKDSELQIGPLDRQFAGNLSITSKKNKLFF
ncbi:MAG: hypothetical protein E7450_05920 [Ruminococcaceae bacterium]|nr:hypothetical protein [Oscillospiraceae bacterium]